MWKCEIKLHNILLCENHVVPFTVMVFSLKIQNDISMTSKMRSLLKQKKNEKTKEHQKNKWTLGKQTYYGKTNECQEIIMWIRGRQMNDWNQVS